MHAYHLVQAEREVDEGMIVIYRAHGDLHRKKKSIVAPEKCFSRVFFHLRGNLLLEVLPDDLVRLPAKEEQAGGEDAETGPPLHTGHGGC